MPDTNWQFDLEEYIKQGEPDRAEKSEAWQTAIGLQAVDGLNTSAYLLDTAKNHIEGKITIDEAQRRIHSYYEQRTTLTEIENETREADIVSARIAKLLGEKAFQFSPAEWLSIHRRLFEGVFSHAGQIRQYNITKKEWVLNGDTVTYADWNGIRDTLDYDFATEKRFSYEGLSVDAAVRHLAKFASDIWQIHPFGEGNTRATAVFIARVLLELEVQQMPQLLAQLRCQHGLGCAEKIIVHAGVQRFDIFLQCGLVRPGVRACKVKEGIAMVEQGSGGDDGIRPVIDHYAKVPEMPVHIADYRIKHQHFVQRVDKLISHLFVIRPDSPHAALRNEMSDREVGIRLVGKKLAGGAENAFPTG